MKEVQAKHFWLIVFSYRNIFYRIDFIYGWKKKKNWGFWILINFPKVTGNASSLAYCCGGTNFDFFRYTSLPFMEKKQKISLTSLCNVLKNIFKTFPGQAWCPAVTDTYYSSVLNPKQSLKNFNLLNWHHLRHIHPWKGLYYMF